MSIENDIKRIADALEKQVLLMENPLKQYVTRQPYQKAPGFVNPEFEGTRFHVVETGDVTPWEPDPLSAVETAPCDVEVPGGATEPQPASPEPEENESDWDPMTEPLQKRYADRAKCSAIDECLKVLGIEPAATWSYVKKHEKILAQANKYRALSPTADTTYTWSMFRDLFLEHAKTIGKEKAKALAASVIGCEVVDEEHCAGKYFEILQLTDPAKHMLGQKVPTGSPDAAAPKEEEEKTPLAPVGDVAAELGIGVSAGAAKKYTKDDVLNVARAIASTDSSLGPVIVAAIKHLAPGVTMITDEQAAEAVQCLKKLAAEKKVEVSV